MTKEERRLWYDFLKRLPVTVHRQKNIGSYIVDFFIASKNIVIELDGRQHSMEDNREADRRRDDEFFCLGIRVLRYRNSDVSGNFNLVCNDILKQLQIDVSELKK